MYITWQTFSFFFFLICFLFSLLGIFVYSFLAKTKGWVKKNYRGDFIPFGHGVLLMVICMGYGFLFFVTLSESLKVLLFLLVVLIATGWIDDRFGNEKVKGMKGHFATFFQTGRPTTGVFKALIGAGCAFLFATSITHTLFDMFLYSFFLTLSTNLLNLLDLRPGRALKGFWILLFLGMLGRNLLPSYSSFFMLVFAFSLASALFDFKGKAMLGDAGANGLGFVCGCFCVLSLSRIGILCLLFIFLVIHWYAEQGSISFFIKKHAILRRVDEWGRDSES